MPLEILHRAAPCHNVPVTFTLDMRGQPSFPFYAPTEQRPLAATERRIVERLLEGASEQRRSEAKHLMVVGRCGCGKCPTIFFEAHEEGDRESDVVSYAGRDAYGGLVGAVLLQKNGRLSQLEFFSIDGHDPWGVPGADTLEPY